MFCAITNCKNNHQTTVNQADEKISYHSFPNAKNFPTIRKEWINLCKHDDKFNPDSSHICSLHFLESDFEHDSQNESTLGFRAIRKILKESAIPTLNLTSSMKKKSVSALSGKKSFVEDKENLVLKEKVINNDNNIMMPLQEKYQNEIMDVVPTTDADENALSQKNFNLLQDKYNKLEQMYNELQTEQKSFKHTLKIKDKRIRSLRQKLYELKKSMPKIGKNTVVESFTTMSGKTLFYQQYEDADFDPECDF